MQDLRNKVAQLAHFTTLDLKSAYHQVEIRPKDRPYTAFEANGKLDQSKRFSFRLTNAAAWFQRIIDDIIERNDCKATFPILITLRYVGKQRKNTTKILIDSIELPPITN